MSRERLDWWGNLQHGGLLLDAPRLSALIPDNPPPLSDFDEDRLRRRITQAQEDPTAHRGPLVTYVLETICGFGPSTGQWYRGAEIKTQWSRKAITGESIRPRHLWLGKHDATLPVFIDDHSRLGIGKGRRAISHVLGWMRQGKEQLALITNGQQWRLVFAGLDYEAFCQWDADAWFAEGELSPEFDGFRALFAPDRWTPAKPGEPSPLLAAINDSRKGQADLSQILGERVRQAAELLIQAHTPALKDHIDTLAPQDIYRAAVRMIMRLVVVLFAESREGLLARDNPVFHNAYSLQGLREQLERTSGYKLASGVGAYPRILALLRLIHEGSSHVALPVPAYGGELFAPGKPDDVDGMQRALHLFETATFGAHQADVMTDYQVQQILDLLTRTKVKIRQGRSTLLVPAPVDFSTLDSEYIGILYEGLLDFELRCAAENEPVVFLAVGNQPALPLTTLLAMDDRAIKNLLEKLKDSSEKAEKSDESGDDESGDDDDVEASDESAEGAEEDEPSDDEAGDEPQPEAIAADDPQFTLRQQAEQWAIRACRIGNLVAKPRGRQTPESELQYEQALATKARQIVVKVVLPGQWYLVRWGGTRKGSGTFYTRPQLAIPTVHRTLRPLAYDAPPAADGANESGGEAAADTWTPKKPEEILGLKVCDPACGSGSFPLSALRFLTGALYESLLYHNRVHDHGGRAVLDLIHDDQGQQMLASESLPCRPEDDEFEPRTRAILRRYIVERCIYGVDLDPLAVELCRLSLWIETMDRTLPLTFLDHKIKCGNSLVGAWFDQFLHYPAMAWEREGGDKNHTNGVHYPKGVWTKAIADFKKRVKPDLIKLIDGDTFAYFVDLQTLSRGHDAAQAALAEIHSLGIEKAGERSERYQTLQSSPDFQRLKEAFDLWCALWFWPADQINSAPLPTQLAGGEIEEAGREVARQVAREQRFFHWELEFPDVFNASSRGFDAILGNPPWDIGKPSSKEFFSAVDPLYRSYGKQEAVGKQREYFHQDMATEHRWLKYNAGFKAISNWVKFAGYPFGDRIRWKLDPKTGEKTPSHDFNLGDRGRMSYGTSERRHKKWKARRQESIGYVTGSHAFRHQGSADINLYKLFLEQAHALLHENGRLGLIVPSGLYSDFGTGDLRRLFVDHCRWEWLFGFENREKIFAIDSRFKFNPVIIAKGGRTRAIRTAFMRRSLADWEQAEQFATPYTREQVVQFSPRSRAILEIQSQRDLEVLTKIYANSVLLGDESENGWGIKYATEFHMTNDSKLFPPRPKWEEWGYRPDEYSRWIKGPWRPIEQLYEELGVDADQPQPIDPACQAAIDATEVIHTDCRLRCAQPPYDRLPIPRADIPAGIILSREATHFIHEDDIPEVTFTDAGGKPLKIKRENEDGELEELPVTGPAMALPLYQGRMIWQFDFAYQQVLNPQGQGTWEIMPWFNKVINGQYLLSASFPFAHSDRVGFRDIQNATNQRTTIFTLLPAYPSGNKVPVLHMANDRQHAFVALVTSFVVDRVLRRKMSQGTVNWFYAAELSLPSSIASSTLCLLTRLSCRLNCSHRVFAPRIIKMARLLLNPTRMAAFRHHERTRIRVIVDAIAARLYSMSIEDFAHLLSGCDWPSAKVENKKFASALDPKGFWRVDKDKHPEHRHTVLSLIAFHDLQEKIAACGGDTEAGIEAFCNQNEGEGWMLPETLRLADYGLGHDERAKEHQPVRECFGPRFYDWQLAQSPEESWRECHLHARNLLGESGYQALLDELAGKPPTPSTPTAKPRGQQRLFETEDLPLFPE